MDIVILPAACHGTLLPGRSSALALPRPTGGDVPLIRPYLDPTLPLVWRGIHTLQVGLDPRRAVAFAGASTDLPELLRLLGGTEPTESVLHVASAVGRLAELRHAVTMLSAARLVVDGAPALRRGTALVEVVGSGPVAESVVRALRGTGLGRCVASPEPCLTSPDLAVVAASRGRGIEACDRLVADGVPHLWAHARDGRAVVGPLVLPGRSSCLRCHDLHRTESDPAWPRLVLAWEQSTDVSLDRVTIRLTAALAARQALAFLDGRDVAARDASLEEQPDGDVVRVPWPTHPGCGCAWGSPQPPASAG